MHKIKLILNRMKKFIKFVLTMKKDAMVQYLPLGLQTLKLSGRHG